PINETANLLVIGYCSIYSPYYYYCYNASYALNFSESGLPTNTTWGVTEYSSVGSQTVTSSTSVLSTFVWAGLISYQLWTVPTSGGQVWVGTADVASPVMEPVTKTIAVTFQKVLPSSQFFWVNVSEDGLANGTSWGFSIGTSSFGTTSSLGVTVTGGASLAIN